MTIFIVLEALRQDDQVQPQWEVQSNNRAVVDYLGTVNRLIKEGEIYLGKRGKEKNPAKRRALREPI